MLRALILFGAILSAGAERKPVPSWQAVPEPYSQVSFQRSGVEVARYHYGKELRRPFVYPLMAGGKTVTRMGHPHDPESHSHHNSVWISHHDVNGVSFWDDRSKGRIVHQRIEKLEDSDFQAAITAINHWIDDKGSILLEERRKTSARKGPDSDWVLAISMEFKAPKSAVTFGKTPFGFVGVRMAKTIGVHDGGGRILNSEGMLNETNVFWKQAKWVDYSGSLTATLTGGATLFDHPQNPRFPSHFHVRNDGWMGASFNLQEPFVLEPDKPLRLTYVIWVHTGIPESPSIKQHSEKILSGK